MSKIFEKFQKKNVHIVVDTGDEGTGYQGFVESTEYDFVQITNPKTIDTGTLVSMKVPAMWFNVNKVISIQVI